MTPYVLGFVFWEGHVALIHKNRGPTCIIGKLNGLGGRVEKNESPKMAMIREFREEGGIYISADQWDKFAVLRVKAYEAVIHCYKAFLKSPIHGLKQCTDEQVAWYISARINLLNVAPNVKWLVPLALEGGKTMAQVVDSMEAV